MRPEAIVLPEHIAQRIQDIVARTSPDGGYIDNEAARYGGIALMRTLGAVWLLRPDGTLWEVDDDTGRPLLPLAPAWHHAAMVCGTERYAWLAELIPQRPEGAAPCAMCGGEGMLHVTDRREQGGILCPQCRARGWNEA